MNKKVFERWNWEFDFGEKPLSEDQPLPPRHAIALYDANGHLYRVMKRVKMNADKGDDDSSAFETFVYDYFCEDNGRILQKRVLGIKNEVDLIVFLKYDDEKGEITETAWNPSDGSFRNHTRKAKRAVQ